ncbi:YraN family protein [Patescibacteria group bacterium]|nr:YraN family protein [Patescibacteria group bacterium]
MDKMEFGHLGEDIACEFLINRGYKIILRNFYTKFGEIDIISSKNNELFFVEVKTRANSIFRNYPENAVSYKKQQNMSRTAEIYLKRKRIYNIMYSFSVVAIILNLKTRKASIKFFERI